MRHVPGAPIATVKLPPVSRIELVNHAANRSATPRSRGRPPNPPGRTHNDSPRTGHRIRRILWIDDEFDRDNALTRLLGFEGFRIDIVGSATDGLAKAEAGSYDGIVLDLRLPDMFGLSVLKRLVADKNAAPVLVVTGYYHEPEIEADALRAGAAAFRHKPLIIDDLTAVLCLIVNRPVHSEAVVQRSAPVALGISLPESPGPPALAVSPSSRRARIFALSRKLADPSGTTLEFVTTAGMLRRMLKGWRGTDRPLGPIDVLPRDVRVVIQYLENSKCAADVFFSRQIWNQNSRCILETPDGCSRCTRAPDIGNGGGRFDCVPLFILSRSATSTFGRLHIASGTSTPHSLTAISIKPSV